MIIKIDFIDSILDFNISNIYSFEIENKKYLYRITSLFYSLNKGNIIDGIMAFDNNCEEIKLNNKLRMFLDYFDFGFDSKKYSSDIVKYILANIEQCESKNILSTYSKLCTLIDKELSKLDLSISVLEEEGIENIIKMFKLRIQQKDELLDNLFLIIDLEVALNSNKVLCFTDLKQYLTNEELLEFYKYATYNSIRMIMIEHKKYDYMKDYEKIIVIDRDLDEFVI